MFDCYAWPSGIEHYPSTVTFEYFDNIKYLPGISILLSIGTIVWILAFLFSVAISKRMTRALLLYVPIFVLWLTCVASPVWNELRYALGLFWAVPIVIQVTIKERMSYRINFRRILLVCGYEAIDKYNNC